MAEKNKFIFLSIGIIIQKGWILWQKNMMILI